jgi:hypothetical protein
MVVVVATGDQMQRRAVRPQDLDALRQALTDVKAGKREPASLLAESESTPA